MLYTSVDNDYIKSIKKLDQKKYRDLTNSFIIEGEHLIEEAIKNQVLKALILLENEKYNFKGDTKYVSKSVMKYLTNLDTIPKMIGICNKQSCNEIKGNVIMLDNIQDPGNLGTIIRSSKAFNIDTIIISLDSVDLYNSKVIRATQGLIFGMNIIVSDIKSQIKTLKIKNYVIYGTKVNGGKELKAIEKNDKFAIIMGSEGQGVKKELLDLCDEYLYIKMNPNCESLNVAVATSIIMYELSR